MMMMMGWCACFCPVDEEVVLPLEGVDLAAELPVIIGMEAVEDDEGPGIGGLGAGVEEEGALDFGPLPAGLLEDVQDGVGGGEEDLGGGWVGSDDGLEVEGCLQGSHPGGCR